MDEVVLSPDAAAFFADADKPLARRIARRLATLEQDPRQHNNIKRLAGELAGVSRFRLGDWRVLFTVAEEPKQVSVLVIAHRRDVYE